MSRFYASIQGNRGEATRQGTSSSGIYGHIRGWDIGAKVECYVNSSGDDVVRVYLTSGSTGDRSSKHLGDFTRKDLEETDA